MIYIYDILLNFNDNLYEFYEWEKDDYIYHIKRIPIVKVKTKVIEDILNNKIKVDNNYLNIICNKTELFKKNNKVLKYSCLITDGYKVFGILLNDLGIITKISDLLLDESFDAISISNRCNLIDIEYNIIDNIDNYYFLTRKELEIKNYLCKEINNIYKSKNYIKLKYLYFEYYNKNNDDIKSIYKDLIDSLSNINDKHYKIFELLKLCNTKT